VTYSTQSVAAPITIFQML